MMDERTQDMLTKLWRRQSASPDAPEFVDGVLAAVYSLGLINQAERQGWLSILKQQCPGHDGGGQSWCSYCGDLPPPEENECPFF